MSWEPSDVMVEAAARAIFNRRCGGFLPDHIEESLWNEAKEQAAAALRAAFAAAVEAGEAREAVAHDWPDPDDGHWSAMSGVECDEPGDFPALILRKPQQGEK